MTFFSQIWTDLVEKRLVPVVVVLVGLIVGLPIVVGGSSAATSPPPPGPAALPAGASALLTPQIRALIAATAPDAGAVHTSGHLHDPFQLTSAPPAATTPAAAAATSATSGTTTPASTSTTPATTTTGATSGTTTTHTTTAPTHTTTPQGTVYTVGLQFGQAASVHRVTAPVRLAPFPSDKDPQIAYLGVRQGGASVMFLVSHGAIAAGDGSCQPSANNCQVVTMKPGDTEYFDVTSPTQGLVQYELDLLSISSRHTQTRNAAVQVNRLVSAAGLAFARAVKSSVVAKLSFSLVNGVLVPATSTSKGVTAALRTAAIPAGASAGIFSAPRRASFASGPPPAVVQQPAPGRPPAGGILTLPAA